VALGLVVGVCLGLFVGPSIGRDPRAASPARIASEAAVPGRAEPRAEEASLSAPESSRREVAVPELERAEPGVSAAALSRAMAVAREVPIPERGSGILHGRVVDSTGTGVPDVVVRAQGSATGPPARSADSVGRAAPVLSLEEALEDAAQDFGVRRASRFETRTDEEGRFRLTELPELHYHVQAFKRDFEIESRDRRNWNAAPGTELLFLARPVVTLAVEVLLPDGSLADEATVLVARQDGGRDSPQRFAWSRQAKDLRLPEGTLELTALHGVFSAPDSDEEPAELRSEPARVVLGFGLPTPPLQLRLAGRSGVRGRVLFAAEDVRGDAPHVHLLALAPGQDPDPEALASAEPEQWIQQSGEFAFLDLPPGRYALGVTRSWNGPVEAQRIVEVGLGIERCDLEVPRLDPGQYLVVRAYDPEGEPLHGLEFGFRHIQNDGSSSSSSGMTAMEGGAGVYYVAIPENARRAYRSAPEASKDHQFHLQVQHEALGSRVVALTPGQAEVEVRFGLPARLEVQVMGYVGSLAVGRVDVRCQRAQEGSAALAFARESHALGADGVHVFPALEPGRYVLSLVVTPAGSSPTFSPGMPVATQEVTLGPGENSARIVLPSLYTLVVRVPEATEGATVRLSRTESERDWSSTQSQRCDAGGRVRFEDLPAGSYRLTAPSGGKQGKMTVEVPTGEVLFVPDQ
jgi:hypothetical protein